MQNDCIFGLTNAETFGRPSQCLRHHCHCSYISEDKWLSINCHQWKRRHRRHGCHHCSVGPSLPKNTSIAWEAIKRCLFDRTKLSIAIISVFNVWFNVLKVKYMFNEMAITSVWPNDRIVCQSLATYASFIGFPFLKALFVLQISCELIIRVLVLGNDLSLLA